MEIHFARQRMRRVFESRRDLERTYGQLAPRIEQRVTEMIAVSNLRDLQLLPGTGCHKLTGDRKGQWAVSLSGNQRMIFEPIDPPAGDDPDWSEVTAVRIIEITDYH